jgi:hypothetical protein
MEEDRMDNVLTKVVGSVILALLTWSYPSVPQQMDFIYSVPVAAHTSAGVFDSTGALIRTLWSNKPQPAGTYSYLWDGKTDAGTPVGPGSYQIRVLQNNISYVWEGSIGNTSNSWSTSADNWTFFGTPPGLKLCFVGDVGWIMSEYAEGAYNLGYISASEPNTPHVFNSNYYSTPVSFGDIATDGRRLYVTQIGGLGASSSYVTVFDGETGMPSAFINGRSLTGQKNGAFDNTTISTIDSSPLHTNQPTGIAVQRKGELLAVAHGDFVNGTKHVHGLNLIRLFDKRTGSAVGKEVPIANPRSMAFSSAGLWVVSNGSLKLVGHVGVDNVITTPISGLSNAVAVAVNGATDHIFALDGGNSQQVKEFDTSYRLIRTYGDRGGYADLNPTITNTRLMLDNSVLEGTSTTNGSWISVADSNDVWFRDAGTQNRILHISPSNRYVNRILFVPNSYNVTVDHGNPKRVFHDMFEYSIDYKVPLVPGDPDPELGGNGSWKLTKNWGVGNIPPSGKDPRDIFLFAEDLSNGRTYAVINDYGTNTGYEAELPDRGPLRYTGAKFAAQRPAMERDGSMLDILTTRTATQVTQTITRENLIGFDGSNNPIRSTAIIVAAVNADPLSEPYDVNGWGTRQNPYPSADGVYPVFNAGPTGRTEVPHLGGIIAGRSSYLFEIYREACQIFPDMQGHYPCSAGYGGHAGIMALAEGHHVIVGYDGQYASFGNAFSDFYEDGLLLGEFTQMHPGRARYPGVVPPTPAGFAGNIANMAVVTVGPDIYMYIPTEGGYPPIERWRITNLSSIHEFAAKGILGSSLRLTKTF